MNFPIKNIRYIFKYLVRTSFFLLLIACAEVFDLPDPTKAPRITSIDPQQGGAGTLVSIEGVNFHPQIEGNIVKFNGNQAVITSATAQKITAVVPAQAGTGKVELVVKDKATEGPLFTFIDTPLIHSIDPVEGPANTEVTIKGQYFDKEASKNTVKFGGKTAAVKHAFSDTLLVAIVPVDAVSGTVTVTVNEVIGTGPWFEFISGNEPVHTITGIDPESGSAGTMVSINGQNFDVDPANNIVMFNGVSATVTSATPTKLIVEAPANGSTGLVSVTIRGKTANGPTFSYEGADDGPVISDFTPKSGIIGTIVTITGQNFGNDKNAISVKFNGTDTPVQEIVNGNSIKVWVPNGATTGKISITINNSTATSTQDFTVMTGEQPIIIQYPSNTRVRDNFYLYGTNFSANPEENTVKINDLVLSVSYATTGLLVVDVSDGAVSGPLSLVVNGVQAAFNIQGGETEMPIMVNQWAITGNMVEARQGHTATLLGNGKVLVAGGRNAYYMLNSVEIFDPATNTWAHSGYLHLDRSNHTATLMQDGKVLLVGGYSSNGVLYQCEIYDPATGISILTNHMNTPRALHSTVLLNNGNFLVVGGTDGTDDPTWQSPIISKACEIYNPATNEWSVTGSLHDNLRPTVQMFNQFRYSSAVKLNNGKVLFAGYGDGGVGGFDTKSEIYDPATGQWTKVSNFQNRGTGAHPLGDLVMLNNGNVFLSRDSDAIGRYDIYQPSSNSWIRTGDQSSNDGNREYSTVLLNDGKLLLAGGYRTGIGTFSDFSQIFDPATGKKNDNIGNIRRRQWHTATKLTDGTVIITGGFGLNAAETENVPLNHCEIFVPGK